MISHKIIYLDEVTCLEDKPGHLTKVKKETMCITTSCQNVNLETLVLTNIGVLFKELHGKRPVAHTYKNSENGVT